LYLEEGNPKRRVLLSNCNTVTTSSPPKKIKKSNNKILYQKKTRKQSWTMWRYTREARP
jgi:hypothetical protein